MSRDCPTGGKSGGGGGGFGSSGGGFGNSGGGFGSSDGGDKKGSAKFIVISRRALAREGDYEMMPVCACVRVCVR